MYHRRDKRRGKRALSCEIFEEIIAKTVQIEKGINLQNQETQQTLGKINPKKFMHRHITIKLFKTKREKKKVVKDIREKYHITMI